MFIPWGGCTAFTCASTAVSQRDGHSEGEAQELWSGFAYTHIPQPADVEQMTEIHTHTHTHLIAHPSDNSLTHTKASSLICRPTALSLLHASNDGQHKQHAFHCAAQWQSRQTVYFASVQTWCDVRSLNRMTTYSINSATVAETHSRPSLDVLCVQLEGKRWKESHGAETVTGGVADKGD